MAKDPKIVRNIGFYGHSGAGKTSLAEGFLYAIKKTDRLCKVTDGSSNLDYEPEEEKRQISIQASFASTEWNKFKINLVDTPGESNFFNDSRNCINAVDGIILVVDAVDGVKVQAERSLTLAKELGLPIIIFINKLDKERANFANCLENIKKSLRIDPMCLQIPIGESENFKGTIDIANMKAHEFEGKDNGAYKEVDIPADLADQAKKYKEKLIEKVAEQDDALLEKYLDKGELSEEEVSTGLLAGIKKGEIIPVMCGTAAKNFGTLELANAVIKYFPSPADKTFKGLNADKSSEVEIKPDPNADPVCLCFKTIVDPFAGKLNICRVLSGSFTSDATLYNATKKSRERLGSILEIFGKKQTQLKEASVGDIIAFPKLKTTTTGDVFCNEKNIVFFDLIKQAQGAISYAVKPKTRADEDKMGTALGKVLEEDASLQVGRDEQTNELILTGAGQLHLEVTLEKIKRRYSVAVELQTPKVPYKETIKKMSQAQGKYKKQSGGKGQYGDTFIQVDPKPKGEGFEFVDKIVGGAIPKNFIPSVEKGVIEAMKDGVIAGYPVIDIKVSLYDGSFHDVDSSDLAFKIAGSMGFKKAFMIANPILLEPIVIMEITVPEDQMGDIIGDLNSRRGKVLGMEAKGANQVIKAQVPMAEILAYANDLTSMTSGKGSYTMEFSHNEEVPAHLAQKIIDRKQKEKEEAEKK